jgi:hypothetical protein
MSSDWQAWCRRCIAAARDGLPLSAEDAAHIGSALEVALYADMPLEATLFPEERWRSVFLLENRRLAARAYPATSKSVRARAAELHKELRRYCGSAYGYEHDQQHGAPINERRRILYELLEANRGKVPGVDALRLWLGG